MDPAVVQASAISQHADRTIERLVQCCLVGPTTSSLALRATAKGGCGLDLAVPTRPLTSKRSTPRCADIVGSIASRRNTTCLLSGD
jgi:hypothetical protein